MYSSLESRPGLHLLRLLGAALLLWGGMWVYQQAQWVDAGAGCGSFQGGLTPDAVGQPSERPAASQPAVHTPDLAPLPPTPRLGFGLSSGADASLWAQRLGASWYLDWQVRPTASAPGLEHWQMVRLAPDCFHPSRAAVRWTAQHFPGQVWVIGNEPDVIWQDNLPPEAYARLYGELYWLIKSADPSARVAVAGISQPTPLRLAYLERVLAAYQQQHGTSMPVDWWTVHGFVLREERGSWGVDIPVGMNQNQGLLYEVTDHDRLGIFQQQMRDFRHWLAQHGYQHTPLALTEFGILMPADYGFPAERVAEYLQQSFAWLQSARDESVGCPADDFHLVQRWAWFSLADALYPNSDLADLTADTLTPAGQAYRTIAEKIAAQR